MHGGWDMDWDKTVFLKGQIKLDKTSFGCDCISLGKFKKIVALSLKGHSKGLYVGHVFF